MIRHICPLCGYPDLKDPPYDLYGAPSFDICPCCGCEFGYKRDDHLVQRLTVYIQFIHTIFLALGGCLWTGYLLERMR
jgi:hypothetical protein